MTTMRCSGIDDTVPCPGTPTERYVRDTSPLNLLPSEMPTVVPDGLTAADDLEFHVPSAKVPNFEDYLGSIK